jgi:hypothetical protein
MHSRPLEFDDLSRISDLASELVKSHSGMWANLRTTRRDLDRDPYFVSTLTIPETTDDTTKLLHNLPTVEFEDTGFVGREKELSELKRALLGSYPVVTVIGEGGLVRRPSPSRHAMIYSTTPTQSLMPLSGRRPRQTSLLSTKSSTSRVRSHRRSEL